jgi:hypothetical protein
LEYKDVSRYTSAFLGTIAAGFLIIFHFKPELIEKYDGFKLVVLSLILTLPLLALNAIISACLYHKLPDNHETTEKEKNIDATMGGLMFNFLTICASVLICYLWSLNFKWFLGLLAVFELLLAFGAVLRLLYSSPKAQA